MEELSPQSLVKRAQKIRERMLVEHLSGVDATDRDSFLSQCIQYEGKLIDARFQPEDSVWQRYNDNGAWDEKRKSWSDWEDWSDWHKF